MYRILAAALLCGVALPAHAGISCNLTDTHGNSLSYTFAVGGHGYTNEISVRRNGAVISNGGPMWSRHYDSERKMMYLEEAGWTLAYEAKPSEADTSQAALFFANGHKAAGYCYADHSMDGVPTDPSPAAGGYAPPMPAYAPPQYVPPAAPQYVPPPAHALNDVVPFVLTSDQQIIVKVGMGGWSVDMQLDTGANLSSVGRDLAGRLVAGGYATEGEPILVHLADDSTTNEQTIVIKTVTIGSHTVQNVRVGIVGDGVNMLLGLPVLNRIGKFTIDSAAQQLTFG